MYYKKDGRYSPEYISLIGFCASYCGRFFDGGYARAKNRNMFRERVENLKSQAKDFNGVIFENKSFEYFEDIENAVVYCDPPYFGTKQYSIKEKFNYNRFYEFLKKIGDNNYVFISIFYAE